MVTSAELQDDEEYEDIIRDVRGECSSYGQVLQILIPRVRDGFPSFSEGLIFVEFMTSGDATVAHANLSGRKFADRTVMVNYVSQTILNNFIFFFPIIN